MSFLRAILVSILVLAAALPGRSRAEARLGPEGTPLEPAYLLIHSDDPSDALAVLDRVSELGGRRLHLVPPTFLAGELPVGLGAEDLGRPGLVSLYRDHPGSEKPGAASRPRLTRGEAAYLRGWRAGRAGRTRAETALVARWREGLLRGELPGGMQVEPEAGPTARGTEALRAAVRLAAGSSAPAPNQNTEFMLGRIVVNLILPESKGSGGDVFEDWEPEEVDDVRAGVLRAWTAVTDEYLNSPVTVIYNWKIRVPVGIEPGQHTGPDSDWIVEAMARLGFTAPPGPQATQVVHDFNNDAKRFFRSQWAYTAFIPDTSNLPGFIMTNSDGRYVSYALRGGPYFMCPHPAGGFGEGYGFAISFMRETATCFWALEEAPNGKPCEIESGYLRIPNKNSSYGNPPCNMFLFAGGCVMQYSDLRLCEYTAGQVGIIGTDDEDEIPRIWNVEPSAEFEGGPVDTLIETHATIRGRAFCPPKQNLNPEFDPGDRIDYGSFLHQGLVAHRSLLRFFKPDDGKWDETEEPFTFEVSDLAPGANKIHFTFSNLVRVKNSFPVQKTLLVIGINFRVPSVITHAGMNEIRWTIAGVDFNASYSLYRKVLDGSGGWELLTGPIAVTEVPERNFSEYVYWDHGVHPGEAYAYRVRGDISIFFRGEQREFTFVSPERSTLGQAPLGASMISQVLPNPMRDRGVFSIVVPDQVRPGVAGGGSGASGAPGAGAPAEQGVVVPTLTTVSVHNVRGERVRTLQNGGLTGGRYTFLWDGRDDRGRRVTSGVYFIHAVAGATEASRKVVVLD